MIIFAFVSCSFLATSCSTWSHFFTLGWYKGMPIEQDIYVLYVIQAGFYLHAVYATVFMDQWRQDFILMILHHVVTIALIAFSFAVRYCTVSCTQQDAK